MRQRHLADRPLSFSAQEPSLHPSLWTNRQTFENSVDYPIYIYIEPWPDCYKLEPGDRLTVSCYVPREGDALVVHFVNENELVVWPTDLDVKVLFNGQSAEGRSWNFER